VPNAQFKYLGEQFIELKYPYLASLRIDILGWTSTKRSSEHAHISAVCTMRDCRVKRRVIL